MREASKCECRFCFPIWVLVLASGQFVNIHWAMFSHMCASLHVDHTSIKSSKGCFESQLSGSSSGYHTQAKSSLLCSLLYDRVPRVLPQSMNLCQQQVPRR